MRQRPKPANYLNRFGQKQDLETKTAEKERRALIVKTKKKSEEKDKKFPSRGKTNLAIIERRHITPDAESYGWIAQEEGMNEGSKVSQFRSLDDIPDGLPASVIRPPNKYSDDRIQQQPPKSKTALDDMDDDNFWAQPSPKAKQIKSAFIAQQASAGDDWGMPDDGVSASEGFDPQNNISALTSLDDFPEDNNSPRYEEVRGEHVPSGHIKLVRDSRDQGSGGQIAKMPTMQRMRRIDDNNAVPAAVAHKHVDHGFSPPRGRQQQAPDSGRDHQRGFSPVEVPPLPVQKAKGLPEFPGQVVDAQKEHSLQQKFGKMRRGGFVDNDDDDYEDIEVDSFAGSPRRPKSDRSNPNSPRRFTVSVNNKEVYGDDSEDDDLEPPSININIHTDPASGSLVSDGGRGGYSKGHAPGPYNKKNLNLGLSSPPRMMKNAPPLPSERGPDVPEDQKLFYSKQPRSVNYTPYTLKDYRDSKPKDYQEIPKRLKPDLNTDTLKAKRANKERVKEFSKNLQEYNKSEIQAHKKLPASTESRDLELSSNKQQSKTERMKQYGKRIPKPKGSDASTVSSKQTGAASGIPQPSRGGRGGPFQSKLNSIYDDEEWNAKDDMMDDSEQYLAAPDPSGMEMATANKIDELEAKRGDSRRQIEAIKRSLKL